MTAPRPRPVRPFIARLFSGDREALEELDGIVLEGLARGAVWPLETCLRYTARPLLAWIYRRRSERAVRADRRAAVAEFGDQADAPEPCGMTIGPDGTCPRGHAAPGQPREDHG